MSDNERARQAIIDCERHGHLEANDMGRCRRCGELIEDE